MNTSIDVVREVLTDLGYKRTYIHPDETVVEYWAKDDEQRIDIWPANDQISIKLDEFLKLYDQIKGK